MRFLGRGQGKRMTESYPSSSQGVSLSLTHEETMDAKGSVNSWPWNCSTGLAGLLLSLWSELFHMSASSSGLTGNIYVSAGEPGLSDEFHSAFIIAVYFIDIYAMEILAASGGLPCDPGSSGPGSIATRKPLTFCYAFLQFFSTF